MEKIGGYFSAEEIVKRGLNTGKIPQETPKQIHEKMENGEVVLVDIRGQSERQAESISGSSYSFLGKILQHTEQFDPAKTYALQCRNGNRSVIAASILKRAGIENVINLDGGIEAWKSDMLPVETNDRAMANAN